LFTLTDQLTVLVLLPWRTVNVYDHTREPLAMAENIYSKGTRVWFEDKDQAWISAEVTSVTKGSDDSIKLIFIDERGKVPIISPIFH